MNSSGINTGEPVSKGRRLSARYRYAVSGFIVFCLLMQFSAFIPDFHPPFPFMKYPMYANSFTGTPSTDSHKLTAVLEDGSEVDGGPKPAGFQFFVWNYDYVRKLKWGVGHENAEGPARKLAERLGEHYGQPVRQLVLETTTYQVIEKNIESKVDVLVFDIVDEEAL